LALILGSFKTKMEEKDAAAVVAAKAYADSKFSSIANVGIESVQVVATLPTENINAKTIYLVAKTVAGSQNVYDEFMYISSQWEKIGDTTVDLSDYYTKEQIDLVLVDYYKKTDADVTFAKKVDVYTKTETYNKTEVDAIVASMSASDVTAFTAALFPA